ncbi:LLM class flavin-dependent oxidoreductase [Altererythrobacter xixiisoli]|uniref:LLM class flavin-dependent oxidoreductase n=1 Tax=Croceibacterium xixiisoli TaxID=1476466 RepID=A0A6I4TSS1_9SPHN|nr:LLM class flavin-dependent oxidoreductase [Croceibacterium xixiisoli]MXO99195.1 LLM class flavin-dependent oxidoreductase [Croceibacterium xixiisoli]
MRIDLYGWTRDATRGDHRDFLALFEEADRLGFDGVWFNEFHFQDPPQPYPSTLLLAAALFARTERIRIGTSILVLPLHGPLLLAEMIAQLDHQSGGRLDIGIGRGTDPQTFTILGIDHAQARERFEAAFDTMLRVWSQPLSPEHRASAPPLQQPHPPLYQAGTTPETLGFAARRGLPLLLSLEPPEGRQLATYAQALAETGAAGTLARSSLCRYLCMGRNTAGAEAAVDELLSRRQTARDASAKARGVEPAPFDRNTILSEQVIWGDPEQCIAQIAALRQTRGTGALRLVFNGNGVIDNASALASMRLFAETVLPAVRDV